MKRLLKQLGIEDVPSFWTFVKQFMKFGVVGLSNTLISLAIYYLLVYFGLYYILANIAAFGLSVLNAYFWNSKYVFKKEEKTGSGQLMKVYCSYGLTFVLSMTLLYLMVDVLYFSEYLAPVLNMIVTVPLNFVMNRFWAFK